MNPTMNQVLGKYAIAEIREAIKNCKNARERAIETARLAAHFCISKSRIYEITKDLRPKRATRADKGKRIADLETDEALKFAASIVVEFNVNPAEALLIAKERGFLVPVELATFQRYLREKGLHRTERRRPMTPNRRFEAERPGELFQFDISGLKERWFDTRLRKIVNVSSLEVSKNHENTVKTRVRVWRFVLLDDYSRNVFLRYYGVDKPNSSHVVDFLLRAYAALGVPHRLYTDNDPIIKFQRNKVCSEILNKALADSGGYELFHHLPGNSRATGKVERLHQTIEEYEKVIGLYLAEGRELTLDILNDKFAANVMERYKNTVHSSTGQTPNERWNSKLSIVRRVDYELLKSIFMADEFDVLIKGDVTITVKSKTYQLPTNNIFQNWIGERVRVIFPDEADFFTVIGLDGNEYDISKEIFAPDVAGEFKSTKESEHQRLRKELKKHARESVKTIKTARDQFADEIAPIPLIDGSSQTVEIADTNLLSFPKPETDVTRQIASAAPAGRGGVFKGGSCTFWEAYNKFLPEFPTKSECKVFLDGLFSSRDDELRLPESEIRHALDNRQNQTGWRVKAV